MPRLFSALLPPDGVKDDLADRVVTVSADAPRLRWIPADRWHVTLGFFGDHDDENRRAEWLDRRVTGLPSPRIRLTGGGAFSGVLWVGVEAAGQADATALTRLAEAAGAEDGREFRAHLSVARARSGRLRRGTARDLLGDYAGPWFTPDRVALMRTDRGPSGLAYRVVASVPLTTS